MDFFEALEKVQEMMRDCSELLAGEERRLGEQIFQRLNQVHEVYSIQ